MAFVGLAPSWAMSRFCVTIFEHVREAPDCFFMGPLLLVLDDLNAVRSDGVYWPKTPIPDKPGTEYDNEALFILEVLSPDSARIDRGPKRLVYEREGIPYYWLLDPATRTLEVYELRDGRYTLVVTLGGDNVFHPALFPCLGG